MTNLIASIIVLLTTNWTDIGTVEITSGTNAGRYTLQQGQIATNHVAKIKWRGEKKRFTLSVDLGPIVGEQRIKIPPQITVWTNSPWHGYTLTNIPWGTNYLLQTNGGWWMADQIMLTNVHGL